MFSHKIFWSGIITLIFVSFCALQWDAPAIEDEVLMHKGALIWLYKGADRFEMSHTPLYLESTSLWQKAFGPALAATPQAPSRIAIVRSFGVFVNALNILILTLAGVPLLLVAFTVLHPYFIQYALLLDYDTTVLGPPLLLAAILIQKWDEREPPGWGKPLAIGSVLGLALFAKELTPIVFLVLWPLWAAARKWRARPSKAQMIPIVQALVGSLTALLVVFALLKAWAAVRGFEWYEPLLLSKEKFFARKDTGQVSAPWVRWGTARFAFLSYLSWAWIGLPTLFVLSQMMIRRFKGNSFIRKTLELPFAFWTALAIMAAYTWLVQASFYFPKYAAPAWPLFVYAVAVVAKRDSSFSSFRRIKPKFTQIWPVILLFSLGFLNVFDPLAIVENRSQITTPILSQHLVAIGLPTLLLWLLSRHSLAQGMPFVLFGALAYFFGTNIRHATAQHETRYLYGEHGFRETVAALRELKAKISPDLPVQSVARDLAWALGSDANYLELQDYEIKDHRDPIDAKLLVSRTYGEYSIGNHPKALADALKRYPCHASVAAPGQRYEWWWIPQPNERCEPDPRRTNQ